MSGELVVKTIGHGTASAELFGELLRTAGVEAVVDIRRYPGSRRHPHFGRDAMAGWLADAGVAYRWIEGLGGRRRADPTAAVPYWRNAQFGAYAAYMATGEFADAVEELLGLAATSAVAVMCSEAVWWRCHRRLLADHLVLVEGRPVQHVFHDGRCAPHPVAPGARAADGHVAYDG